MPLIKIDYNENILGSNIDQLIKLILSESMRIYNCTEDKISIFTSMYGEHHFSTAAAEIEVRAKSAEYQALDISPNELREQHITQYTTYLEGFIQENAIPKGVVFTITFEDWEVRWLAGSEDE